jgi:hypothetical protein
MIALHRRVRKHKAAMQRLIALTRQVVERPRNPPQDKANARVQGTAPEGEALPQRDQGSSVCVTPEGILECRSESVSELGYNAQYQ